MNNKFTSMKGLIVGCGSIGERHLHNLKKIGIKDLAVYDTDKKKANELAIRYKTQKFYDLDSALSFEPNFSVVCTYPNSHLKIANICITNNCHVFIEKPISSDIIGVEKMLKRADSKKVQIAVGYNMRFDKGLCLIKEKLMKSKISTPLCISSQWGHSIKLWRPGINYKDHYVLKKGGGIILDASHEYDYMRWLLDDDVKSVYCQTKKSTTIKTQTESLATIVLKFRKGTIGTLIIDHIRPQYERKCHIIGEKGDLKFEYVVRDSGWKNYDVRVNSKVTSSFVDAKSVTHNNFIVKLNDMYVNEMKNFVKSVLQNKKPLIDGWEGLKTLKIGMVALESARKNKIINL